MVEFKVQSDGHNDENITESLAEQSDDLERGIGILNDNKESMSSTSQD